MTFRQIGFKCKKIITRHKLGLASNGLVCKNVNIYHIGPHIKWRKGQTSKRLKCKEIYHGSHWPRGRYTSDLCVIFTQHDNLTIRMYCRRVGEESVQSGDRLDATWSPRQQLKQPHSNHVGASKLQ